MINFTKQTLHFRLLIKILFACFICHMRHICPIVDLEDLVVMVLAIELKFRVFIPGRGRKNLRELKIRSTTTFGGEVKLSVPCRNILRHVKEPCGVWKRYFVGEIHSHFSKLLRSFLECVSGGYCQRDDSGNIRTQMGMLNIKESGRIAHDALCDTSS
jgi:hypothetical protein